MIKIEVDVRLNCQYTGSSYETLEITEDDIRKLAEDKAREKKVFPDSFTFEAKEIIIKTNS